MRRFGKKYTKPSIGYLENQQFILAGEVKSLEKEIADFCETSHAVGCASGTDALLLSLIAAGVGPDDEVITTSYSFFATAGMIAWLRAKPVFVDIDPATFNLRTDQVARKITSRTKAIIAVHLFGQCARMEELTSLGLPVIEDACQSIGAKRHSRKAGSIGFTGCFSFFPTKNLGGYGDGGLITTNDPQIAEKLLKLRGHGQSTRYHHLSIGTNSRLDEIQAAVLRVKLRHLATWNQKRAEHAKFYEEKLRDLPIILPQLDSGNDSIHHQYVIRAQDRDRLKDHLSEKGIGTAVYYPVPLPHQPCFEYLKSAKEDFPAAQRCSAESLALPIYPELTTAQQQHVTDSIRANYK